MDPISHWMARTLLFFCPGKAPLMQKYKMTLWPSLRSATAKKLPTSNYGKSLTTHSWCNRQAPDGVLTIKAERIVQTTNSTLYVDTLRAYFVKVQKIFWAYINCN
ncbi:hypothetical protein CDAR_76331 [Caerostris darwini]|uniref:Uncharacterized protein n=1 Tax=Caerostris darwini TaxID=1538125 RepID=A0AAV4PXF2_9ARAC|nr:hypothetical protein CDAR_76331 [Caerostris darwini]